MITWKAEGFLQVNFSIFAFIAYKCLLPSTSIVWLKGTCCLNQEKSKGWKSILMWMKVQFALKKRSWVIWKCQNSLLYVYIYIKGFSDTLMEWSLFSIKITFLTKRTQHFLILKVETVKLFNVQNWYIMFCFHGSFQHFQFRFSFRKRQEFAHEMGKLILSQLY